MANGTWKIARGRGNAQLPLVIVVALALVLVLLGKSQSGLFDKARTHVTDWMAPVLERLRVPVQGFDRWVGSIGEIFSVYDENLKLKQENARLRQWRNAEIVLEGRLKHYQALLHALPDPKLNAVLARVIGRASRPFMQTMILDAGTATGAEPGQAVADASGMIGRIYLAGQHTSWVILLSDLNSRIPVTIAPGNTQAILTGDNTPQPMLDQIARTATIKAGDQVVSSGDGGLLPQGLPIGMVVADGKGHWRVALLADPGQSQDVEVLHFALPPEQLPATAILPVVAAGLKPEAPPATNQPTDSTVIPTPVTAARSPPKSAAKPALAEPIAAAANGATTSRTAPSKPTAPASPTPSDPAEPASSPEQ
ncbi:MAG TPA: rod shape-determining protein MreC [Rhizomicrobium sp.]|nr:rod shape-determining protein MreC [Rhizomicrobium sp.]